jgi:release factor glutamine methyltransferase
MEAAVETAGPGQTAARLIAEATAALVASGVPTARLDAEVLLASACGMERTGLYACGRDAVVPERCRDRFLSLLARRRAREPLAYIVGHKEFWSLDFSVTPDVLIPRPETELLVELALQTRARYFCDLGTGSGCIAVALASESPQAEIWALEVSPAALAVAQANARRHAVAGQVRFVETDLFVSVAGRRFDAVISNPPYVPAADMEDLQPELAWEPRQALDGGAAGLDVIQRLLAAAPAHLVDGGYLFMEIGACQEPAVTALAKAAGFAEISVHQDAAGLPRVLLARR